MDPFEIKAGDVFSFGGQVYRADSDAAGEFRASVMVTREDGLATVIWFPHGAMVEPVNEAPC